MKANEFRIGNWIYIPQTKTNEQIGSIEENGRFTTKNYKSSYSSIECLEPIPLTEEWFLKLRFQLENEICEVEDFEGENLFWWDFYGFSIDVNVCSNGVDYVYNGQCENVYIEYVHQLQNLYFALTKEELKIKKDETI